MKSSLMLLMILWPALAWADISPAPKMPPEPRFFPIRPSMFMQPVTRNTYGIGHGQPVASPPAKKATSKNAEMTEEQARQLLSIYPIQ